MAYIQLLLIQENVTLKETHMNKPTQNIQAIRSHKWITDALITLMQNNSFQELTVKEILLEADVSRQTFYRHFTSKEDVLQCYFDELCNDFFRALDSLQVKTIHNIILIYFQYWEQHKEIAALLYTSVGQSILVAEYAKALEVSLSQIRTMLTLEDASFTYAKDFIIGGLFSIKKHWIENGTKETPEELAALVIHMLQNVLRD